MTIRYLDMNCYRLRLFHQLLLLSAVTLASKFFRDSGCLYLRAHFSLPSTFLIIKNRTNIKDGVKKNSKIVQA